MKKFLKNGFILTLTKSLRFRFFIIVLLVGILPIFAVEYGILTNFEDQSILQRGNLVQRQCMNIAEQLVDSGYIEKKGSEII